MRSKVEGMGGAGLRGRIGGVTAEVLAVLYNTPVTVQYCTDDRPFPAAV